MGPREAGFLARQETRETQVYQQNKSRTKREILPVGSTVLVQDFSSKHWDQFATVTEIRPDQLSYLVRLHQSGNIVLRGRDLLKPVSLEQAPRVSTITNLKSILLPSHTCRPHQKAGDMGFFFDSDSHSEDHQEHDNSYKVNRHSGLFNFEGGSGTLAILLIAALTAIPVFICMWRWVKRDRIRLRAQYPVAYARYKSERKEVRELAFPNGDGNQAFRTRNRDVRDECTIEWGTTGALEFKPDLPSSPAYWEGPNKEGKPSKEDRDNREGGRAPKVSRSAAPRTAPYTRPVKPSTRSVDTQAGDRVASDELGSLVKELRELVVISQVHRPPSPPSPRENPRASSPLSSGGRRSIGRGYHLARIEKEERERVERKARGRGRQLAYWKEQAEQARRSAPKVGQVSIDDLRASEVSDWD